MDNVTVSGSITSTPSDEWDESVPNYIGGIVGSNRGTVTSCDFQGFVVGSTAGGIAGANYGTVSNSHKLVGVVSNGGSTLQSTGCVIGIILPTNGNYNDVVVSGNTFRRNNADEPTFGIAKDGRLPTPGPSNNGTAEVF